MANGVEARSPFLDSRFIEYSAKIPTSWKVSPRQTKRILKELVKGRLPDEIIFRKKQGFVPPLEEWILQETYLREIREGIESLHDKGIFSEEWYGFYKTKVLKEDNETYNLFKIRMYLLIKWAERWVQ